MMRKLFILVFLIASLLQEAESRRRLSGGFSGGFSGGSSGGSFFDFRNGIEWYHVMSFVVIGGGIIASIAWRCYKCSHTKSVNEIRNTQKVLPTDTAPPYVQSELMENKNTVLPSYATNMH